MGKIRELQFDIAASIFTKPCTIEELMERDFLLNISKYGIDFSIGELERLGGIYYKGKVIHTNKKWAKDNLKDYELF